MDYKRIKTIVLLVLVCLSFQVNGQVKDYKNLPDFDNKDYQQHLSYMVKPFALVGQTLYLQDVNDELINYF